jgi:hypothetical protein
LGDGEPVLQFDERRGTAQCVRSCVSQLGDRTPAALGGAVTTINFSNTTQPEALFNSSSATMTRQLILTTVESTPVPEPASLLLATGLAAAARARRLRRFQSRRTRM